jgi:hypothetical protein
MLILKILLLITFLILPTSAFAWGPLTHIYLGTELFSLSPLLPAAVMEIIRRYRKDFLYGNIMADLIVGKKYMPPSKNSHSWNFAFDLLSVAATKQQKAFVYGYLSHLAADTVAHNTYTIDKKNIGHTLLEIKADSIIDKRYRLLAMEIDRHIQLRNDIFLASYLDRFIFSFKTHKRIFKGVVFLTAFYPEKMGDFLDRAGASMPVRNTIEKLHEESLDKIVDLFRNWEKSDVLKTQPMLCDRDKRFRKKIVPFLIKLSSGNRRDGKYCNPSRN